MKKLLALLVLVSLSISCTAQVPEVDIIYTFEGPRIVVWEAVTHDINDAPLLPSDIVTYEIFFRDANDPAGTLVFVEEVFGPTGIITPEGLDARHYYFVGVEAIVTDSQGGVERSGISWSNDPARVDPTRRFAYYLPGATPVPKRPIGLRTEEQ